MGSFFVYPDVGELVKKNPGKTAFMQWREAQWAEKGLQKSIVQHWVPLSRVSPLLVKAVLIGEDDKFYQHEGFDYEAMEQAFQKDLKAGHFASGASTISQQLTKNLFLSPEKSLTRKVKEAILTWRMEHTLSKRRILELYVNVAEWGDGVFGVEAASRHYFHKPASQLSSQEASRLASVLPNPIRFNAVGDQRYVTFRSNLIHAIMVRRGIAVEGFQEVMEAKDEPSLGREAEQGVEPGSPAEQTPPAPDSPNAQNAGAAQTSAPAAAPAPPTAPAPETASAKPAEATARP
jgi:monofunctional biosynthetic peptidoglycan transglycosylase